MNGMPSPFGFWTSAAPWLALAAFGMTFALLHARPSERSTFLNTLWLFLLGIGGEAAASMIWALNFTDAAGTVHTISASSPPSRSSACSASPSSACCCRWPAASRRASSRTSASSRCT